MYLQTVLAGAIGAALTFAGQHLISVLHQRASERDELLRRRNQIRDDVRRAVYRMGQQTGDYLEISQRGSLDAEYWEKFRVILNDAWHDMSDAMVPLPVLADVMLLQAVRRIHTLFALRINCFYNEHPDAVSKYLDLLQPNHPELRTEDFQWNMDTTAQNRKLYWLLNRVIDDRILELGRLDAQSSLKQLRAITPPGPLRDDDEYIYDQEHCWPSASVLVFKKFRS